MKGWGWREVDERMRMKEGRWRDGDEGRRMEGWG